MNFGAFAPTVENYTLRDDGTTLVLHAEVAVIDDQWLINWNEEDDRVTTGIQFFSTPPTGPDVLIQEVEIDLDASLNGRHVCYGTTELNLGVG